MKVNAEELRTKKKNKQKGFSLTRKDKNLTQYKFLCYMYM